MADYTSQITAWYQAVQYRAPDAASLATYNASLNSGVMTQAQVQAAIENDPYTTTYVNPVIREYQAAFGRVPDQAGVKYWVGVVAANPSELNNLGSIFASSSEFMSRYGTTSATQVGNTAIVTALYTNVLGREPDAAGLAYWVGQQLPVSSLLNAFAQSPEFVKSANSAIVSFQNAEIAGNAATSGSLFQYGEQNPGQTYTLTTGIDVITGTAGNDTIIGDFSTPTANAGDQINGAGGTNTLKIYSAYNSANMPVSVTNVQVLELGAPGNNSVDLTGWTKAATGIATVKVDDASAMSAKTITTTTGQGLSLATGSANVATAGAVTWAGSATDTSLNLTLNGYQGGQGVTPAALTITGAADTTLNLASTGAANKVSTLTLGAVDATLNITGDKLLTVTTDLVSSGGATILKTIDASADTGGVNLTFAALTNAAFKFTGGAGNDAIKFADNEMGTLTAGSQLDGGAGVNKLGLLDTAISAAEYTAINATKNFQTLGLNAAVTVDASQLTSIKSFSLDTNGAQVINNMSSGSSLAVTAAHAANITTTSSVGVHDLAVTVGTATTSGLTLGGTVNIGQDTISLVSNGDGSAANVITGLTAKDNSVYTITGSNDLTITAITAATTAGSKYDASGLTGKLSIAGNTAAYSSGSSLGDIIVGGSRVDTIKASINNATLTGNGGNDTFNVSVALGGTDSLTTITDFSKGDKITFAAGNGTPAFSTTKVDLSAAGSVTAALNLLAAGDGSTDSAIKWGVYSGNTYIVEDNTAGATYAATDVAVKAVGVLDLSASTLSTVTLTFA